MAFKQGNKVQSKSDPSKIGVIEELGPIHAGLQYYTVFWGGIEGTTTVPEIDLQLYHPAKTPADNLLNGNLAGYKEFLRLITYLKLTRDYPLRNNIYAFNASRTRFYPYQFKPLIKFLDSPNQRLLICDEVGLGKTIEAGLILTELRARQTVNRVLVICPANLTVKWELELRNRFGEDFRILQVNDFIEYLKEYDEEPEGAKLNGIISLESIRTNRVLEQLDLLLPSFDLIIIDEAHHMRNPGRKQRKAGVLVSQSANAMLMLTATPIHLGNENLFSLLNISDEEDFPDFVTSDLRFRQNEPIVKAQICLGQIPPKISDAKTFLTQSSDSPWIEKNPLYSEVLDHLDKISRDTFDLQTHKKQLIELQRDLAELNLLSHIFTRTRKREVHESIATRRAVALEVEFTPDEREFYEAVTAFIIAQSEARCNTPLIHQWRLNMPQRRLASSIPAMVEYYREHLIFDPDDWPDDFEEETFDDDDMRSPAIDLRIAQKQLQEIVKSWPSNARDSKYEKFKGILDQLMKDKKCKVMVFAFFKGTLQYLFNRLKRDGIKALVISGDIDPDDRPKIIEQFQNDQDVKVLLSSRVGSEGLDFQFCNTLFNYDLPWNPMEVEQRIGRLDRIGQESPVIRIYNLWIKDTIEERILRRLYERIHIFERSVGALEMILGDIVQQLEREIFSKALTPEEQDRKAEEAILAIERKIHDLEKLEAEAAQFIRRYNLANSVSNIYY
jgi:SNF2 family DNA or RNA helicase